MEHQEEFVTTDIYLVAALLEAGAILKSVDRSNNKHVKFILHSNFDFEKKRAMWINGTYEGNLASYAERIRMVKQQLYS